jgi:hypothetical protein
MMNPFRSGFYAIQLFSHKVMRYLVPFFLIAIFAASGALAGSPIYRACFWAQLVCYACASLAWMLDTLGVRSHFLAFPQYFVLANVASLLAFYQFLRGKRYAHWEPIR